MAAGWAQFWRQRYKTDPDSEWRRQNKELTEDPVYRFEGIGKDGILVEKYRKDGADAVRKIAKQELEENFLYDGGRGGVITEETYLKWKRAHVTPESGGMTPSDRELLRDRFNKFETHEACWDIHVRGGVGETPLHLLYLKNSPDHLAVGAILLGMYPLLCLDLYEGEEYFGESALHIAIINNNLDAVKLLLSCGALVNQRATGRFFLPEDQKNTASEQTNYEGVAYYGEYPLAFAACIGNAQIYDYLLKSGADPNRKDSFGNTVLHMTVISDQVEMFKYAVRNHMFAADMCVENNAHLTPMTLAAKLGRQRMFQTMLDLGSVELWRYSNITCSVYPLQTLDTICPDGNTNWRSSLMFIINGDKDEHLDMLDGEVIRQLLEEKWKKFAYRRFIIRLLLALFHLLMISLLIYLRPDSDLLQYRGAKDAVRYIAEIIVSIGCFSTMLMQMFEIQVQGFMGFLRNCKHAPAKTLFLFSCLLMLCCIPVRFLSFVLSKEICQTIEDTLIILAVPGSWIFLLFFARSVQLTGPFVTMIYKMVTGDLYRFGIIYTIILTGFTQGFFFLFRNLEDPSVTSFLTIPGTVMTMFQMTLGEFRYEEFDYTRHSFLTKLVFAIFMVLVPILLLNMLIAMMGNTYQQIIAKSEKEWKKQWAKIVIILEREFMHKNLDMYQQRYSIKMTEVSKHGDYSNTAEADDRRGLMVVKNTNKTLATQKKGAVRNWKFLGKEVILQLREQKRTGRKMTLEIHHPERRRSYSRSPNREIDMCTDAYSFFDPQSVLSSAVEQLAWEKDIDLNKTSQVQKIHTKSKHIISADSSAKPAISISTAKKVTKNQVEPLPEVLTKDPSSPTQSIKNMMPQTIKQSISTVDPSSSRLTASSVTRTVSGTASSENSPTTPLPHILSPSSSHASTVQSPKTFNQQLFKQMAIRKSDSESSLINSKDDETSL